MWGWGAQRAYDSSGVTIALTRRDPSGWRTNNAVQAWPTGIPNRNISPHSTVGVVSPSRDGPDLECRSNDSDRQDAKSSALSHDHLGLACAGYGLNAEQNGGSQQEEEFFWSRVVMSLSKLLYLTRHVFLPPKLPQEDDQTADNDKFLCKHIQNSILAYQMALPNEQKSQWDPILRTVKNFGRTQESGVLAPETVENQIFRMSNGDTLAFFIRAQNAGVILRKLQTGTIFEAFEVTPPAEQVMGAKGKLLCSYPGPAIQIPSHILDDALFRKELASFLSQMHADVLDSAATTRKAASIIVEERDTAHPRYITQLLTGILRGLGQATEVTRIRKRIADDVLWENTKLPWRRSPAWLVLRIALQTTMYDPDAMSPNTDYKTFMVFAMTRMLQDALRMNLPSDVIFCMRAKICRRLYKLGVSAPEFVQDAVSDIGEATKQILEERWLQANKNQAKSSPWAPDDLKVLADTYLSLDNSTPYLTNALHAECSPTAPSKFQPHHHTRSRSTFSPNSLAHNDFIALADFELLVQDDLDRWVQEKMETSTESTCVNLAACIDRYHRAALELYATNPEDMSLMFLIILELWVALDKLVISKIPLLEDYSPEIPLSILEQLLLHKATSIQRLERIIQYLRKRHSRARRGFSIFTTKWSSDSFAVRYFEGSSVHQSLKSRIEAEATAQRSSKLADLQRKNDRHERLMAEAVLLTCEYEDYRKGKRRHLDSCHKCSLERQARELYIYIHEWPLSRDTYEAQATVFELDCPIPFGVWRAMTHKILYDICTSGTHSMSQAEVGISLKYYNDLQTYYCAGPPQAQRITLASTSKSFIQSHYRTQRIPTTEDKICVNNGLRLVLVDSSKSAFFADRPENFDIAGICTFQIPSSSPYKSLQYSIIATTHTSNEVIANQSNCHKDINLHEYIAFGSLRAGGRLQWLNIARELPARALTFRCEEVFDLFRQAAGQVGPLAGNDHWEWHRELTNARFGHVLLDQLEDLMGNVKANWLEATTVRMITTLVCRLLASVTDSSVIRRSYSILREARDVTLGWVRLLAEQLRENEDECRIGEIQHRLCEVAAICRSTYDVDSIHVKRLLVSAEDVAVLLECGIIVHDNSPPDLSAMSLTFRHLLARDRRLSHHLEPTLSKKITDNCAGLDQAVSSLWTAFHAGTKWRHHPSPNDRWLCCETQSRQGSAAQHVDLNLLDGSLLVDGKPLGRLPQTITRHPTYSRIFGRKIFDVIPSDLAGVEYASRTQFSGYQIFFGLQPKEGALVIRARRESEVLELIPHERFRGDLPNLLVSEHVHWLDLSSGDIEVRPLEDPWISSEDNWWIHSFTTQRAVMKRGSQRLVDIRSPTFEMISSRLGPLERAEFLTITYSPDSSPSLSIDLPRFRLSFFMNDNGQLESHNLPGMEIDENQSSGTMVGLVNQLVLCPNESVQQGHQPSRCVIIPFGTVDYKQHDNHSVITIDTSSQRKVTYHKYRIDEQLGRLVSNVSLLSKLYKVFLHAVTSHCLPDPLTGCTGTEEALDELRSASCQSFQSLNAEETKVLEQISSLSPVREFYPPHIRVMQTVHWSQLSPIAQHDGYRVIAEKILQYARQLQISQGASDDDEPVSHADEDLLRRAAYRNAVYYPERLQTLFKFPTSEKYDVKYSSRDLDLDREAAVCELSAAVRTWSRKSDKSCQLFDIMKQWCNVSGPTDELSLSYSPDWLKLRLPASWMSLYDLCRRSNKSRHRWKLSFSLCAFQYTSAPKHRQLARTLLAFATNPGFSDLQPPPWPSYDLSRGCEAKRSVVSEVCDRHVIEFEDSKAMSIPPRLEENEIRLRQRRFSYYEAQCEEEISRVVGIVMSQWPSDLSDLELSAADFPFLDISTMMNAIRSLFQSWYHNYQLRIHLQQVQSVLGQHSQQTLLSTESAYTFSPSTQCLPSILAYISHRSLFARAAPEPMQPPITLTLDSLSLPTSSRVSQGVSASQQPHADLELILSEFQSNDANPFHQIYGNSLAASQQALCARATQQITGRIPRSRHALLQKNRSSWENHVRRLFKSICESLGPSNQLESILFTAGLWPRLTIRSLLSTMTSFSFRKLSAPWQQTLMSLAQSLLSFQRASRLAALAHSKLNEDFWKELHNSGMEAMQNPDWLLIQVDSNFHARPIQIHCAEEMIAPSSEQNSVFQLNMGEGKSSVIVPLASSILADGQKLVRVVVLKALANQMFGLLVERLSGLANRRIFYLPISRTNDIGATQAEVIRSLYEECIQVGGILVVQPEHILSFKLMGIDHLLRTKDEDITTQLLETQRWLDSQSRDILDESDEILHVRYQLVYTMGQQHAIDHHPDRWIIIQQVLSLTRRHAHDLQSRYPGSLDVGESCNGSFPQIRFLHGRRVGVTWLTFQIAEDVLNGFLPNCSFGLLPKIIRGVALEFMCKLDISPESAALIKDHFTDSNTWNSLLVLRGLLAHGILGYVLKERRWRVDYGLDFTRTQLAVPYRAKDVPALRAEFGHPDVAIMLTCLSYYYQGLSEDQIKICFHHLLKLDNPTMEYENWVHADPNVPQGLRELCAVNVRDIKQMKDHLIPHFHHNHAVIDFFLAQIVFPREAKEFPKKIATSGWDIAECKEHTTTGFSGTKDNEYLLPTSIAQCDPLDQMSTNAQVLAYLLQPENDEYVCSHQPNCPRPSAQELLDLLVDQTPQIQVLLDVGAQILDMRNDEVAQTWLELREDMSAALFFDDNDHMVILTRDGTTEAFVSSPFNQQLDKCLVYLDDVHTRGTDLKLPKQSRAAVTLGPKVTKDRLLQGAMRMRKLGHGQSVLFIAPQEVDQKIRRAASKHPSKDVRSADILRWVMQESCSDIQHHIPHWSQQGVDYRRRQEDWSTFCSSETADLSILQRSWLQPEARTLEDMYGFRQQSERAPTFLPLEIQQRCETLGVSSLQDIRMEEEQEREVIHEIEQERQVERPPKAKPAVHHIHDDVRAFIQTGEIAQSEGDTSSFFPIHIAFDSPSAWSPNLVVTHDFRTTIRGNHTAGEYLRPVNWILSSTINGDATLVIVSDYEANELLPKIRRSKSVHLHQYAPRVTQTMISFEDLQFYCIPPLPTAWTPPSPDLTRQLNLFAGQLYLPDYDAYQRLCTFLGLYSEGQQVVDDARIQSDGFVKPSHRRGNLAYLRVCRFKTSPLPTLRNLVGYRRKGMSYASTHMGKLLHARPLTEEDFILTDNAEDDVESSE